MVCGTLKCVFGGIFISKNENSKDKISYNNYSSVNLKASSDPTHKQEKDLSFSNLHELRKQNPFWIIIGWVNTSTIRNKFEPLNELIKNNVDSLMVSETKIGETFLDAQFCIYGYSTPYRLDRNSNGEGILLYVRDYIPSKMIKEMYGTLSKDFL